MAIILLPSLGSRKNSKPSFVAQQSSSSVVSIAYGTRIRHYLGIGTQARNLDVLWAINQVLAEIGNALTCG